MTIEQKLDLLNRIYGIYDAFAGSLEVACRKYCAHCCTSNVSLTTLEGYRLVHSLEPDQLEYLQRCLVPASEEAGFSTAIDHQPDGRTLPARAGDSGGSLRRPGRKLSAPGRECLSGLSAAPVWLSLPRFSGPLQAVGHRRNARLCVDRQHRVSANDRTPGRSRLHG